MCQVMTYEGSKEQILSVDEIVLELYAYRNQLRKAAQRGMNDHHNRVMGDYIYWFSVLVNPQVQNSLDKETLKTIENDLSKITIAYYLIADPIERKNTKEYVVGVYQDKKYSKILIM